MQWKLKKKNDDQKLNISFKILKEYHTKLCINKLKWIGKEEMK